MVLLVAAVSFLATNLTAFLIFEILFEGYILIESTDAIITPYLFKSNFSILSFRLWLKSGSFFYR